ncbi:MAG: Fe-S-containing protein [Treponema sp.]|nr:Fe-S-containing protein [Treponema sp.]
MAKNLYQIAQTLLILPLLLAIIITTASSFKSEKSRKVHSILIGAIFALALIFSIMRDRRIVKYNQINNIYLIFATLVLSAIYCALTWIFYVAQSKEVNEKSLGIIQQLTGLFGLLTFTGLLFYRLPPMIALPFHFVGMDESYFSTDFLLRMTGWLLAFLLLFLFFLAAYKVLLRAQKKWAPICSSFYLVLNSAVLLVSLIGIINSYYRRKFKLPKFVKKNMLMIFELENKILFAILILLAICAIAFTIHNIRIHGEYTNPAEHRKLKARAMKNRRWGIFLLLLSIYFCVDLTAIRKFSQRIVELSPSEEYQIEGNEIYVPLEQIADGHLHRFTWTSEKGKGVRFIVVQKKGNNFGVGFDACEVCGNVGYYERGDEIVCNRCDVVMNRNTIGLKGGCNPIPLYSKIEDGGLKVYTEDLEKEAHRF